MHNEQEANTSAAVESLTIALSKGRILEETLPLLRQLGIEPLEDIEASRKLIFETGVAGIRLVILRATDVPTYVSHGAADLGVAGKDVLMEFGGHGLYEPLDLGIARCRLMTAAKIGAAPRGKKLRVATKYTHVAKEYFARQGIQVDLIKLYGAMELAPIMGLADQIVDVVDTGRTLKANGLEPLELIAHSSARLIVAKASLKMKHRRIKPLIEQLAGLVKT